ncbi:MAG TPA: hypothetical protein VHF69_00100, partial [Candidatus Synoicihabitans sp.]|nr:hypothetical protein [Candidatus Synoicihabitans sp.]
QQQPRQALEHWQHSDVPAAQRSFQLLRAFALQLARDPAAPAALAQVGWPSSWHLSGGADIFLEYCRRTDGLLSTMPTTTALVESRAN